MSIDLHSLVRQADVALKASPELAKLKKATDGFEAIFLKKLFSQMRSSIKETQFGQTFGKEIYNDMFDEAIANAAAKSKTLGMGDMLYNQFKPIVLNGIAFQEMRNKAFKVAQPEQTGGTTNLKAKQDEESGIDFQSMRDKTFQVLPPELVGDNGQTKIKHDLEGRETHSLEGNATSDATSRKS